MTPSNEALRKRAEELLFQWPAKDTVELMLAFAAEQSAQARAEAIAEVNIALKVAAKALSIADDWNLCDVQVDPPKEWALPASEEDADNGWCSTVALADKLNEIAKAITRLPAEVALGDGWLPIESAPKDGTEIILCRESRVSSGYWVEEIEEVCSEYHSNGTYLGQYPSGIVSEAFWMSQDGGFTEKEPPTHWQPLPKPPMLKAAHGGKE